MGRFVYCRKIMGNLSENCVQFPPPYCGGLFICFDISSCALDGFTLLIL